MPNVFCVRANYGQFAPHFLDGGYAAIGWLSSDDLTGITSKDQLYPLYKAAYPEDTSNIVIGNKVGQIARFLFDIKAGDYIILPTSDTDWLHYGVVEPDPSYFFADGLDGCHFLQRRKVVWAKDNKDRIQRGILSIPLQNTLGSLLTVFAVSQHDEFFAVIGKGHLAPKPVPGHGSFDSYAAVLDQILQLDPTEFEILVKHLLDALGFEETEHTGKSGDGGVDVTGEFNVSGLTKVKIYVQAKRYKPGSKISAKTVKELRMAIPAGA
jgi:predicted Mrr-cat superfamily restriction endonuclease